MKLSPKNAWKAVRELQAGLSEHHIKPTTMSFRLPNGKRSKRDSKHMSVLRPHFSKTFDNKQSIDQTVLEENRSRQVQYDIAGELTYEEFENAIRSLNNHTSPGLNGITSEQIKALDDDHREILFLIIKEYFDNTTDIPEWHWGNLWALPKHGDLSSPHKWRGINLLDTASKIMSAIITNRL